MLGGVAHDRHDHDGDEELAQADRRREGVQRMDEDLAHPRGRAGRCGQGDERSRQRPGALARRLALPLPVAAQVTADDGEIEQQEQDRHRHGGHDHGVPLGRPGVAERRGERESHDGRPDKADLGEERAAVDPRSVRARNLRDPVDEQEIRDHASRQRAEHDNGQVRADGDERDDELRRVPEARVEEAADARPRVLRRVFRRLADQPGERDEGDRGEYEERDVAGAGELVHRDRGGCEEERPPQELAAHGDLP